MPTEALYIQALRTLEAKGLAPSWKELLRVHWAAPRHTTSSALLAKAVRYPNYSAANLNYGRLAARIGRLVGMPPRPTRVNLFSVATWATSEPNAAGHFTFTMRPELAAALNTLGWVKGARPPQEGLDPLSFVEGRRRRLLKQHIQRERRLRDLKIAHAQRLSADGRLRCEVPGCGFDFEQVYGSLGHGYAEVHHVAPLSLSSRPVRTRLDDLAIVCANCHAMIHRFGECRTVRGLVARKPQGLRRG